ncbi:MAG TPA: hypothetical protein PLK94_00050 [Alphaproteobacteria bacterium]|nr:hypothetical protein [Alphaproteobacteria bacterium]
MEPITLIAGAGAFLARKAIFRVAKDAVMNHIEKSNLAGEEYYLSKILESSNYDDALTNLKKLRMKYPDSSNIPVIIELMAYSMEKRKKEIETGINKTSEKIDVLRIKKEELKNSLKKCETKINCQIHARKKHIITRPLIPAMLCVPLAFLFSSLIYHPDAILQRSIASITIAIIVFVTASAALCHSLGKPILHQQEVKRNIVALVGDLNLREAAMEAEIRALRDMISEIDQKMKEIRSYGGVNHEDY